MTDKCPSCPTPPGTRCESAPGNCPYANTHPAAIGQRLRALADTAAAIAADMDYHSGLAEWSQHSRELANAVGLLRQWASEIDTNPEHSHQP
jgi:hypothetical protein